MEDHVQPDVSASDAVVIHGSGRLREKKQPLGHLHMYSSNQAACYTPVHHL